MGVKGELILEYTNGSKVGMLDGIGELHPWWGHHILDIRSLDDGRAKL